LDIKEAVEAVESYLEEEAEKLLNLGKVKNRLTSMRDEYEQPQRQSQTTLSNAHSAQGNERVVRKLSDEESKSAMAKMLQWDE
jgi:predicted ribosome quality control (RQC) complex YloA/Tae2 family protein